jgi:small subunit ribosomal protein S9
VSDAEHPEDEPRNDEEASAAETPAESAEEPVAASEAPEPAAAAEAPEPAAEAPEPAAETPEPVAEPPAPAEPVAETPAEPAAAPAEEPVAETPAPAEPVAETPAPAAEQPAPAAETPAAAEQPAAPDVSAETPAAPAAAESAAAEQPAAAAETDDGEEVAPRQRPEIPGADLIPDLVSESDEFMDAEARAAAEAEAEAAAARAQEEDSDDEARPIADAAINLAAGARYTATGKRKTAVARVILKPGTGAYIVNGKTLDVFFPRDTLRRIIRQPLEAVGYETRMDVVARMHGGGVSSQSGALRHGISRALLEADPNLRGELKRRGFLTRDSRVKERKKAGLKKARKRPQFSKR